MTELVKVESEEQLKKLFSVQINEMQQQANQGPPSADLMMAGDDVNLTMELEPKLFYMVERPTTEAERETEQQMIQSMQGNPEASKLSISHRIIEIKSVGVDSLNTLLEQGLSYRSEFPLSSAGAITMPRFVKE